MDLLKLKAVLGLDSSEYEQGLEGAKSKASSFGSAIGSGFKTVAKVGAAAIGAATAAAGAFAAASVKTGAEFDKSMSQVAATMGITMDEMASQTGKVDLAWGTFNGNLRDYAQEMGRNTAFSATQAADALNYMALAGYDVQTSMEMLPNVLNLAAAGNMDLARASDMVTDTQTAFGISLERTSQMVDEMAKAASTGNTSVEQLGDAFLVVGGLAQELNGGMVALSDGTTATYDNVQELEIALTAMANAGIKGSEAGTHMRNMLLKLASPTEEGTKAFKQLGVEVFDSEGNMNSLAQIMEDLGAAMGDLTQEEKLQAISDIFNTRDTAAAEALLNAVGEDWGNIAESILDADGAAQQMADTQLDNLSGDVTLFKSALEGAKIAVSDGLTPTLRDFVKFGTSGLSKLTEAFKSGGVSGAMEAFGTVLSDGLNMIIDKLPTMIDAGMQLLEALGKGILDNLPTIVNTAIIIINKLVEGLVKALPALASGALQVIVGLAEGIAQSLPTLIPTIVEVMLQIVETLIDNVDLLIEGAIQLMIGLANGFINALPVLIEKLPTIVMKIAEALIENMPLLLQAHVQVIMALVQAIIDNLPAFLNAVVQIFIGIVGLIKDYGGQLLSSMGEVLGNLVSNVGTGLSEMFNTFVQWLSQLPSTLAYWAGYAIGSFIKFIAELPSRLNNIFTSVISRVVSFGTNFANKAREMAKSFYNNLINNIASLPSRLASLGSQLVGAITNLPSKFAEVGKNIVQGLWNGISGGWDWLKDKVANLADSLFQGAKDALGIHSPSTKFAWIGEMLDRGFAGGIDKFAYLVDDALENIMTDTVDVSPQVAFATSAGPAYDNARGYYQTVNIYSPTALNPSETARQTRNATRDMVLELRGKK